MLGIADADHQESAPDTPNPFISKLECSLVGVEETVHLFNDSYTFRLYEGPQTREQFSCNFGLNESFRNRLISGPLKIAGVDDNQNVRIVELSEHRFFIATLFLPQFSSSLDTPHPLILDFVKAAAETSLER